MNAVAAGLSFRRDPLRFLLALDDQRDVVRFRAGLTEFTLLKDPETIHRVLVAENDRFGEGKWTRRGMRVMHDCLITREGDPHRSRRVVLQPSFDRRRVAGCDGAIVGRALRLQERWGEGQTIDVRSQMSRVALTIVGETLFSADLEDGADELVGALGVLLREIPRPSRPWARRFGPSKRLLDDTARALIAERQAAAARPDDLLSALVERLPEEEAKNEIVSLLIAGVDTTPGTLAWTWFLLGRHAAVEARLHEELERVLGGKLPTAADLANLPYLEMVLSEVLRLYPPVHFIDRRPLEDVEVDGVVLAAGSPLLVSPLLTHRDPRFYPEPESFLPERWSREVRAERPRYAYFPFGGGPHVCIGEVLARLELSLVVATLAQRWRLGAVEGFPDEPSPQTSRLPMTLMRR